MGASGPRRFLPVFSVTGSACALSCDTSCQQRSSTQWSRSGLARPVHARGKSGGGRTRFPGLGKPNHASTVPLLVAASDTSPGSTRARMKVIVRWVSSRPRLAAGFAVLRHRRRDVNSNSADDPLRDVYHLDLGVADVRALHFACCSATATDGDHIVSACTSAGFFEKRRALKMVTAYPDHDAFVLVSLVPAPFCTPMSHVAPLSLNEITHFLRRRTSLPLPPSTTINLAAPRPRHRRARARRGSDRPRFEPIASQANSTMGAREHGTDAETAASRCPSSLAWGRAPRSSFAAVQVN